MCDCNNLTNAFTDVVSDKVSSMHDDLDRTFASTRDAFDGEIGACDGVKYACCRQRIFEAMFVQGQMMRHGDSSHKSDLILSKRQ